MVLAGGITAFSVRAVSGVDTPAAFSVRIDTASVAADGSGRSGADPEYRIDITATACSSRAAATKRVFFSLRQRCLQAVEGRDLSGRLSQPEYVLHII